jgi:hypothetical protein
MSSRDGAGAAPREPIFDANEDADLSPLERNVREMSADGMSRSIL